MGVVNRKIGGRRTEDGVSKVHSSIVIVKNLQRVALNKAISFVVRVEQIDTQDKTFIRNNLVAGFIIYRFKLLEGLSIGYKSINWAFILIPPNVVFIIIQIYQYTLLYCD